MVSQGGRQRPFLVSVPHCQLDSIVRVVHQDHLLQLGSSIDRVAINRQQNVAASDASFGGWAVLIHINDQNPRIRLGVLIYQLGSRDGATPDEKRQQSQRQHEPFGRSLNGLGRKMCHSYLLCSVVT